MIMAPGDTITASDLASSTSAASAAHRGTAPAVAEVGSGDGLARRHDHQPLDHVAQLADVAGPAVAAAAPVAAPASNRFGRRPYSRASSAMKCSREQRDVAGALAQRRHEDRDDVEPEVEILAEPAAADLGRSDPCWSRPGRGRRRARRPCRRPARRPAPAARAGPWPASSGSCRRSRRGTACRRRPARTCRGDPRSRR